MVDERLARQLLRAIIEAVQAERYEVSIHADNRIEERGMMEWQIVMGIFDAQLLNADLQDRPWPSVLVSQMLPDGTEAHAKWSYRARDRMARVVTIYYPE